MLENSIIKTLAYFDIFDYPLTSEELFRYLYAEGVGVKDYADFVDQLSEFENKDGFYFLSGRPARNATCPPVPGNGRRGASVAGGEEIVEKRQDRVKLVEDKMKIAKRGVKKIASMPFVRAVFVCNTLSSSVVDEDSDIDVFIIIKKGRLFLARSLVTLYLGFFGMRRTKRKIKNKICLSFYVTDDNLNLESVTIKDDIYMKYWLAQLIPVYDPDNLFSSLQRANTWVKQDLPNAFQKYDVIDRWKVQGNFKFKKLLEKIWGSGYGSLLEAQARGMQLNRMKLNYMSVQNEPDTRVVVNDKMLKFHENDRREEYRDKWLEKCKKYVV